MSAKVYVVRGEGSGSEGDPRTGGNWQKVTHSLLCERGNVAVSFTVDDVRNVSP